MIVLISQLAGHCPRACDSVLSVIYDNAAQNGDVNIRGCDRTGLSPVEIRALSSKATALRDKCRPQWKRTRDHERSLERVTQDWRTRGGQRKSTIKSRAWQDRVVPS